MDKFIEVIRRIKRKNSKFLRQTDGFPIELLLKIKSELKTGLFIFKGTIWTQQMLSYIYFEGHHNRIEHV